MSEKKAKKKKESKYVLLVWSLLPETISFYLIPLKEIGKEGRKALRRAHGNYINALAPEDGEFSDEEINRSLLYLNEALIEDRSRDWIDDKYIAEQAEQLGVPVEEFDYLLGSWHKYKITRMKKPKSLPRVRLVESGCIM